MPQLLAEPAASPGKATVTLKQFGVALANRAAGACVSACVLELTCLAQTSSGRR